MRPFLTTLIQRLPFGKQLDWSKVVSNNTSAPLAHKSKSKLCDCNDCGCLTNSQLLPFLPLSWNSLHYLSSLVTLHSALFCRFLVLYRQISCYFASDERCCDWDLVTVCIWWPPQIDLQEYKATCHLISLLQILLSLLQTLWMTRGNARLWLCLYGDYTALIRSGCFMHIARRLIIPRY